MRILSEMPTSESASAFTLLRDTGVTIQGITLSWDNMSTPHKLLVKSDRGGSSMWNQDGPCQLHRIESIIEESIAYCFIVND